MKMSSEKKQGPGATGPKPNTEIAIDADSSTACASDRKTPFINGKAWKRSGWLQLPAAELKVLLGFMSFENAKSHTAFPGDEAVAKVLECDARTVERSKAKLIDRKILAVVNERHRVYGTQEFKFAETIGVAESEDFQSMAENGQGEGANPTVLSGESDDPTVLSESPDSFGRTTRQNCPPNALSNSSSEYLRSKPSPDGEQQKQIDHEVLEKTLLTSKKETQSAVVIEQSIVKNAIVTLPPPHHSLRPPDAVDTCVEHFGWIAFRDGEYRCTVDAAEGLGCSVAAHWNTGSPLSPEWEWEQKVFGAIFNKERPFLPAPRRPTASLDYWTDERRDAL